MSRLSENLAASEGADSVRTGPEFTPEQRRLLLGIARAAIASGLAGEPLPDVPPPSLSLAAPSSSTSPSWAGLMEPRGVFTTLYLGDQLRGCVGYALPIRPLYRAVGETARAAAFEDSRFWPVTPEEASELKISLSVLSRLFPIAPGQVEVGRHGLMISDGSRRGLLLPQVPVENGWDRETFLEQTCRKAGLPREAWRQQEIDIQAFTAEVFGDEDASE
jgi:AmmeMemoRadiSam system protein A